MAIRRRRSILFTIWGRGFVLKMIWLGRPILATIRRTRTIFMRAPVVLVLLVPVVLVLVAAMATWNN